MHFIRKEGVRLHQVDRLAVIALFTALGVSLVITIWSVYLQSYLHNASYVGFLSTFFTIVGILSFLFTIPYIEKNSKTKIFSITILLYVVAYFLFSILTTIYAVIVLGTLMAILGTFRITSFGIILRDKSRDSSVSKNMGLIYTFMNTAWIIGPLIAGFISEQYGFKWVFITASFFMFLTFILFRIFKVEDNRKEKIIDKNVLKVLIDFFKNKNRVFVYALTAGIAFWWSLIYLYMPLFIIDSGYPTEYVGYFLFAVVVPLVLLEYFFGKMTGKKGFKKIFFTGYLILSLAALVCFFATGNVYIIMAVLVLASIGAAMIEPTTEAYFFDLVSVKERSKFYGPYNTSLDVGHALATFFGALLLLFLDFKFIFVYFSIVMLIMALASLGIKNIIEKRR